MELYFPVYSCIYFEIFHNKKFVLNVKKSLLRKHFFIGQKKNFINDADTGPQCPWRYG